MHKWKIGDRCWRPWRYRTSYGDRRTGDIGGWSRAQVVALRPKTGKIIVSSYGWEYEHPAYELKEKYPRR